MGNGFSFIYYKEELLDAVSFGYFSHSFFLCGDSASVLLVTADLRTGSESQDSCSPPSIYSGPYWVLTDTLSVPLYTLFFWQVQKSSRSSSSPSSPTPSFCDCLCLHVHFLGHCSDYCCSLVTLCAT